MSKRIELSALEAKTITIFALRAQDARAAYDAAVQRVMAAHGVSADQYGIDLDDMSLKEIGENGQPRNDLE